MSNEDFIIISDVESIERMLTNAEIDYEVFYDHNNIQLIRAENGIVFKFNDLGNLEEMFVEN